MEQAVESSYRTYIGKEAQFLAHGQQSLFRTHLSRRIIIKFRVTHSSKEHSISVHTCLEGSLWEWINHLIDGMCTADSLLVSKFMTELSSDGFHYSHTLSHNLWSDAITWQHSNFQFHILLIILLLFVFIYIQHFEGSLDGCLRSEERRVGKECRSRWS